MEREQSFIENGSRYQFDDLLLGEGYHQLDSRQDAWYFGTWFNPETLKLVEYAEGDVTEITFDSTEEFIGWATERQETMGYLHIDDWDRNWAVPIERSELEIYMSYARNDILKS
jgi:hypothetical protein